jgi:twitching motility two-component system response regulator PilG
MAPLIMIIDDSVTVRKILEVTMKREGYTTVSFPDGEAALRWLASEQGRVPALILLDLVMPKMDGLTVLRCLKRRPSLAAVPVIVLTNREGTLNRLLARLAGAREYLNKPFTTESIAAAVRLYLGVAEPEPQAAPKPVPAHLIV